MDHLGPHWTIVAFIRHNVNVFTMSSRKSYYSMRGLSPFALGNAARLAFELSQRGMRLASTPKGVIKRSPRSVLRSAARSRAVRRAAGHVAKGVARKLVFKRKGSTLTKTMLKKARVYENRPRFYTHGLMGPKFRHQYKVRYNKFMRFGAVTKVEKGLTLSDADCAYVGHYNFPLDYTVFTCMKALGRRICIENNIHASDPQDTVNAVDWTIVWDYRQSFTGAYFSTAGTVVPAGSNLQNLGGALGNSLVSIIPAGAVYLEIVRCRVLDSSGARIFKCPGTSILFHMVGNSNFLVQNRTKAADFSAGSSLATDVENNPLVGKTYTAWANIHPYKFFNDTVAPTTEFYHENASGLLYVGANDANLTAEMVQTLTKPPPASAFGKTFGSSYCQLGPGEIRRSKIVSSWRGNINNLVKVYMDTMRGTTDITSPNEALVNIGKAVFMGFEKACDSRNESSAPINLGFEVNTTISAIAYCNKNVTMNPQNIVL